MAFKAPRLLHQIQGLEFPDYTYQEYPKWVTSGSVMDAKGLPSKVLVNSKEEETEAMAKPVHHDKPVKEELPSEEIKLPPRNETQPSVVFSPKALSAEDIAKAEAERLAQTPGGVEKK